MFKLIGKAVTTTAGVVLGLLLTPFILILNKEPDWDDLETYEFTEDDNW